ncbi:Uncharacterised protein [Klebsiella pneumoniae]|nr:Uncharacterised protein [Klebsiella pneumoniae]
MTERAVRVHNHVARQRTYVPPVLVRQRADTDNSGDHLLVVVVMAGQYQAKAYVFQLLRIDANIRHCGDSFVDGGMNHDVVQIPVKPRTKCFQVAN